ncbi:MAG TPA: efflux RND transporter periplasmic adaptor subunit [Nitrospiria bacterium]
MNNRILFLVLSMAFGVIGGYWLAFEMPWEAEKIEPSTPVRTPLFYRHPMNPEIRSNTPAKDEMGMDYVPVYADGDRGKSDPPGTVEIDPVMMQNIGVRTAFAEKRALSRNIQATGRVDYDEERLAVLHPKIEGWIDKLYADKTGEPVKKDATLLSIYSPQLVSSQQEYLLALENLQALADSPIENIRKGAEDLVRISRERLKLFDVAEHQILELERNRKISKNLHIHSPFDGIVINVGTREGQYVTPGTQLYTLADLSRVWVYVDIYEYELPWVKKNDEAEMRLIAVPGKTLHGRITYIYPYVDSQTRTIKVRLEFDNSDLVLKPNMFADVSIRADRRMEAVVVPSEAILRSGGGAKIFVVRGPGKFEPREVKLGVEADDRIQILEGVKPGEEVVTSAQFLIDSESRLREAVTKMLETGKANGKMPDMDMDMDQEQ